MKKLLYWVLVAIALTACSSKEQKAEALIKDALITTLYRPETYKPVKTVVSEAFSPYDDPKIWEEVKELIDMVEKLELTESQVKSAKSSMANWEDSYSAFGKNEYQDAKKEYDKRTAKFEEMNTKCRKLFEKVRSELISKKAFIGYKAIHNYRAEANNGNSCIGNVVAIFDKDMKTYIGVLDFDEYNSIQYFIKEILKREQPLNN